MIEKQIIVFRLNHIVYSHINVILASVKTLKQFSEHIGDYFVNYKANI